MKEKRIIQWIIREIIVLAFSFLIAYASDAFCSDVNKIPLYIRAMVLFAIVTAFIDMAHIIKKIK